MIRKALVAVGLFIESLTMIAIMRVFELNSDLTQNVPQLNIINPKRTKSLSGRSSWYPYYAGFSYEFAHELVKSAKLRKNSVVLDAWNGSGTTTCVANGLGHIGVGFDLNPVMLVVAKARLLSKHEYSSLAPLVCEIVTRAASDNSGPLQNDPLTVWMTNTSANGVRKLERAIQHLLVDHSKFVLLADREDLSVLSGIAAFLYLALFKTVRKLLRRFVASNPTWIKLPADSRFRVRPHAAKIFQMFHSEIDLMVRTENNGPFQPLELSQSSIRVGSSVCLPIADSSVEFILGSPPYCTRIDYAIATRPELCLLGYSDEKFIELRRRLLGSSTITAVRLAEDEEWGPTCLRFLRTVATHDSKGSLSYYYKNHLQYFDGIFRSVKELSRVLKRCGQCVLVVQDSYYKGIQNDLPTILLEMTNATPLKLVCLKSFTHFRTMATINPATRRYRNTFATIETVLAFERA